MRVLDRNLDRRERHGGAALLMEAQHLRVVHLVDVIAREHDDVLQDFLHDRIQVLVHGVGRALIPVLADAFCGGRISTNSPSSSDTMLQPMRMWRFSESDLIASR